MCAGLYACRHQRGRDVGGSVSTKPRATLFTFKDVCVFSGYETVKRQDRVNWHVRDDWRLWLAGPAVVTGMRAG